LEFGCSTDGTLLGLTILLASSNGRGGGDLHIDETDARAKLLSEYIVGRWAGDRIAIIGDYHEEDDVIGTTDVRVSETGGYSGYNSETRKSEYNNPLIGDVPWNQHDDSPVDLGWCDISSVVIEAMELDSYVKSERHEEHKYPSGQTYTKAGSFGADAEPTCILNEDGSISRFTKAATT
jgi:hypothetical protein